MKTSALALACAFSLISHIGLTQVEIHIEASHTLRPYTPAWNYFGADEPNYTYAPNGLKLLKELSTLSPTPVYIRVHNLLTTGDGSSSLKWGSTNAYTEDAQGRPVYNWAITDRIFDAFRAAHVRPLVEIGFMPEALSAHPEPYRHSFPQGDIFTGWSYPPKDYAKWSALVTAYATHLHTRYGASVGTWLWEVWNEPDIAYWHGTPAEYDKLYDVTAAAILQALPNAKIGGPESTGPYGGKSEAFLRQFLEHCATGTNAATNAAGAPLDFISFHPKGAPRVVDGHVQMDIGHQLRAIDLGMQTVASFPQWKHTPIILGESDPEGCAACGIAQNPQNAYRNGALYGVSIAEATARTYELAQRDGVNLQGSVTWAFEFENQPYFAGLRDLATNGIDKPVLNVFRMWGMLGGDWLQTASDGALPLAEMLEGHASTHSDINAVATRTGKQIDILVWNYDDRDIAAPPANISLHLDGLTSDKVRMKRFLIDHDHSNAYTAWLAMGSPQQPSAEQRGSLIEASTLDQVGPQQPLAIRDGSATLNFPLARQGVSLVQITIP
jgi:xylan 1,4-beta-xylosidase